MASKLAAYDTGYDDDRFEHVVSQTLHCIICTNVIKDPVACGHNEHLFCRDCITEHLKNHQTCPTCMDPLTVDTLGQAPRGIRNLLNELKIRCEFFDRGCGKFIELGNLESHVRECGFAPAVCSNEGCQLEVNKQDLLHHETAVCEQRRVKCHSCNDIRREMDIVKVNLVAINVKLAKNEEKMDKNETKLEDIEASGKAIEKNLKVKIQLVQEQLNEQKEINRRHQAEVKKSLNEITKQLERMTQQASHEVQVEKEQMREGIAEAAGVGREPKVVIAGGFNGRTDENSVEMFSLSSGTWTLVQPMREVRQGASSVVFNNEFVVIGGYVESMEKLSLNAIQVDQSITWENVPAELPGKLAGHCSVVYEGRLIVIGGFRGVYVDFITEMSLVPPYTSKVLATMRKRKCYHGVVLFKSVIVIVGGRDSGGSVLKSVVMYDVTTNEFKELAPLPYPLCEMAIVKWGNDNVIIIGGVDSNDESLNTVLIYNVKTQRSHMLPEMKYKRRACVAAVVKDTVIVMGGRDEREIYLKSVESFQFDRYTWEELPEMHEERYRATAAVCE